MISPPLIREIRVTGHFGELMQGRMGPRGPLVLISLPCPALWVEAKPDAPEDDAEPLIAPLIGPRRLRALCAALNLPVPIHPPVLRATMPQGGGGGSSTAGLVALARTLGYGGSAHKLARACSRVEGASDPLMFNHAERLLFAPRSGAVLRPLPALPRFEVLGGFYGPVQRTDPDDLDFPDITDLLARWDSAMDVATIAALCAHSARRTLDRRGPGGDPTEALAAQLGAAGWLIAHTGNARGLIFAPGTIPRGAESTLRRAGFSGIVRFTAGGGA